jgi:hypothetical protein
MTKLASASLQNLKLNPHNNPNQIYSHEDLGVVAPFLNSFESGTLKQIETF